MVIKSLNNMFHRHGRWLFAIFTAIIIVSFLGFLTPGQFGFDGMFGGGGTVGTIYGKKVSIDELQRARREIQLVSLCMAGREVSAEPEQAFQLLALSKMAERRGVTVSDAELRTAVRQARFFCNAQGKFDLALYRKNIKNLKQWGFSEADVESAFRHQLVIGKLVERVAANAVVTTGEARDFFNRYFAVYTVGSAKFAAKNFPIKPTDAEIRKYFDGARKAYRIEAKASGIAVEFPYANFTAAAKADAVKPGVLEKFFKSNATRFVDSKGKLPAFKSVEAKVRAAYLEVAPKYLAMRAASDFAIAADEAVTEAEANQRLAAFRKLLTNLKAGSGKAAILAVSNVPESSAVIGGRTVPGLAKKLAAAARTTRPVTELVNGEKAVYIGYGTKVVAARPAEFAEVAAKVKADFIAAGSAAAARKAAADLRTSLEKLPQPQRVAAFRAAKGAKVTSFTFSEGKQPPAGEEMSAMIAMELSNGQFSDVLPTPEGAQLILVEKKALPDPKKFAEKEANCREYCKSEKAQLARYQLQQELLANCRWFMNNTQTASAAE